MTADALLSCPTTGRGVERVLQPFAPRFKGTGFYSTDHRKQRGRRGSDRAVTPRDHRRGDRTWRAVRNGRRQDRTRTMCVNEAWRLAWSLLDQKLNVGDGLSPLTAPVDERPAVQP